MCNGRHVPSGVSIEAVVLAQRLSHPTLSALLPNLTSESNEGCARVSLLALFSAEIGVPGARIIRIPPGELLARTVNQGGICQIH